MSKEINDKAKEYLKAQLSVIPTKEDKLPALSSWKPYQTSRIKEEQVDSLFNGANVKGLGIICGAISGDLEVIDVDTKYDLTGSLWDELTALLKDHLADVYNRLVIAQTKSGGYHIYYRCSSIASNLKLANRLTTEAEKQKAYIFEIERGGLAEKAKKASENDKQRVLIETRGQGGYVIAPPTPGYTYLQGNPCNIPTITPEEREVIFSISQSFDELVEEVKPKVSTTSATASSSTELSPFEDYNLRGDVVTLLDSKGWKAINQQGQRINLLRPGKTDSKTSGNFHTGLRVLRVFSSSTEFNPEKGYNPSQVFSLLECSGDNTIAYRKLLDLGYGKPYKAEDINPTQVKTELIKVEVVNKVTKESSVISYPVKGLTVENIQTALGDEVVITSPGSQAQDEVLKAIELIQKTDKRIYIKEGDIEIREYRYQLKSIFNKYGSLQGETGGLTDRQKHSLLDEVVIVSTKLNPIDKDVFLKDFIEQEAIKELGISEESLSITVDRLTATRDREAQAKALKRLLFDATILQNSGEVNKALELLDSKVKEVKLKDKATEFSSLMKPLKEDELKERQANKPESLNSGYTIEGEDLELPAGAISIFAAPTSHGKTTFLINLALNVAQKHPEKETYLFSYEEDADAILINTLNTYLDEEVSSNNRRTLKSYFSTGSTEYIRSQSKDFFTAKKEKFFKELIETRSLNIHYSNYNSETLIEAIRYLHKNGKPGAIFIDYIQLLNLPEGKYKTYSRQEEIKQICIALKDVAVDTGLPIILGAQFNREVINHLRIHPTKIGEAGDIERIANLIVGFWNNNFLPLASEGESNEIWQKIKGQSKNSLYVKILKNRGGRVGLEEILSFNGNTGKIKNSSSSGSSFF
jgi:replicative DNA helicase